MNWDHNVTCISHLHISVHIIHTKPSISEHCFEVYNELTLVFRERVASLNIGLHYDGNENHDEASKAYKKAYSKSKIVFEVIEELRAEGIEFRVSPYEGDAQLALLMKQAMIDVAFSDDTDLIPYGCSRASLYNIGYILQWVTASFNFVLIIVIVDVPYFNEIGYILHR